jgi:phosphatidate cytidylyltransferase
VTRVLSALVLLPIVVGAVWFLPPWGTVVLASIAAVLAFHEYANIAAALGARIPRVISGVATLVACLGLVASSPLDLIFITALLVLGAVVVASRQPGPGVLTDIAASMFPLVYIGLPLGCLAALRSLAGAESLLLLMGIIVVSDSAQYYTGRAFGRRPLAPTISPKKTREGAIGGLVIGTLAFAFAGRWVFPSASLAVLALVGATLVAAGIVGDLFESLLKRSAGMKDSSNLIPGHGGVLDRIDSWLFAAPVFYVFVLFVGMVA